jgi:outer membrane immunogenic protein
MKKALLAGIALAVISAASASAADLPRAMKSPVQAPYAQPYFNWTGWYAGVSGGYALSDKLETSTSGGSFATGLKPEGGFFGAQIGYNWQIPSSMFVLGVEGDAFLSDINASHTIASFGPIAVGASSKLDKFGTVRGRLGIAVDRTLFYATGGVAIGYNEATLNISALGLGARAFDSQTHVGWTAGGGAEYAFAHNWTAKLEYRYAAFQSKGYDFAPGIIPRVDIDPSFHTVTAGINYKF